MWDQTSSNFKRLRLALGLTVMFVACVAAFVAEGSTSPRALAGVSLSALQGATSSDSLELQISKPEAMPAYSEGTAVYRVDDAGRGIMYARVVADQEGTLHIALPPNANSGTGYRLYVQEPVQSLDDAIGLLLGEEGANEELEILRRDLFPLIQRGLLADIERELGPFIERRLAALPEEEKAEIQNLLVELRTELEPFADEFGGQMLERGMDEWWTIVKIVFGSAGRGIADTAENAWKWAKDGITGLFGSDSKSEKSERPNLTQADKDKIMAIFKEEAAKYWERKGNDVLSKLMGVARKREVIIRKKFIDQWLPKAFEEIVKPALERHGPAIEAKARSIAESFAKRRLLTEENAPRLRTAYIVRSGSGISRRPLLVLEPDTEVPVGTALLSPMSQLKRVAK